MMLQNNRGAALPITLIIIVVFVGLAFQTLQMVTMDQEAVKNYEEGMRALYLAEAGGQEAIALLQRDATIRNDAGLSYVARTQRSVYRADKQEILGQYVASIKARAVTDHATEVHIIAVGKAGNVTKGVEMMVSIDHHDHSIRLGTWNDLGVQNIPPI